MPSASGDGVEPGTSAVTCDVCGGSGRLQRVTRTGFGEFIRSQPCPRCGGAGRIVEHPCKACAGAGRVLEERALDVEIPPGIHDGQRIRVSGEGHAGALGGQAGDVYVLVHVRPHERLVREGDDVFSTIDLTMTEAALGRKVGVATLDGEMELEFSRARSRAAVEVLRVAGCPCSRASAAATTACSST